MFENITQAVTTLVLTKGYIQNNEVKIKTDKQGKHQCKQDDLLKTEKLYLLPLNEIIRKMLNSDLRVNDILKFIRVK